MSTGQRQHADPRGNGSPRRVSDVFEVMRTRSAMRSYTEEPVADAVLERMLDALLAAPSASNKQAWAFVVVRDPARVRRVRAFCPGIIGVPALILVACFDRTQAPDDPGMLRVGRLCVAMAVQNFLLAGHALGLGGCPVSSFLVEPVRSLLDLPRHLDPVLVVPVGHPARQAEPSQRRAKAEVIRYETWK
ncbi:nitroreductase family protein [Goodfellowiella coeruleoviolacea]|uniref:Nitroreductase n=1 Tax=Goodfellowiella coeruleoviolacea TaxID=334858 RepID=A0AAE3GH91_9PSEU|nr:nitroreductase family protein [Goodfellowiella coeruleoviolacea]MCP2168191.1 Nitroreductase [Goodfellowiella coeruleoviolacea]